MAPRGRSRKIKDERMEEVLRHFRIENLGFDEEVVKKVAKQIIKEYDVGEGTDAAWCFITQNNYQLLIEQILEYQELNQPEGSSGVGNEAEFFEDEPSNDEHALAVSGGQSALTELIASEEENTEFVGENLLTNETAQGNEGRPPSSVSAYSPVAPCYGWINEDGTALDNESRSPSVSEKSIVACKRLPCYGWINEDEEHDPDDIIILPPAGQIASEKNPRKRESNWDLRPEDP